MPLKSLILDAGPLLTATPQALNVFEAENLYTTAEVLAEIRSKTARNLLTDPTWSQHILKSKQPSSEALVRVSLFARATGDIAVLSATDLGLCALVVTIEVETNGWRRIRPSFGVASEHEKERQAARKLERKAKAEKKRQQQQDSAAQEAADAAAEPTAESAKNAEYAESIENADAETSTPNEQQPYQSNAHGEDSDDGEGEWITPENLKTHKARFLNLPAPMTEETPDKAQANTTKIRNTTTACLTGDYAMQNVLMQMGLNAVGNDGQRIKEVRTWVLRCHACYKLCKEPTEKFCPSCGNPTLMRTSITYLPAPTAEHPKGYILHLKKNFQYHNRGTVFSMPAPKSQAGASKKQSNDVLILRADQKEWLRGKRTHEVQVAKEERRALKADRGHGHGADVDWLPEMLMGHRGRPKGASSNDKGIRLGKDGLPIIGSGRRNPNIARPRI